MNNYSYSSFSPTSLTSDQELSVIVAALTNVVSGSTSTEFHLPNSAAGTTSSSGLERIVPVANMETCREYENLNQEMQTETSVGFGNNNNDFWNRIGEAADFQQLMRMMEFGGDSSGSRPGNSFN
ncbi:hypothetical protein TSUD_95510 [Trifolium subterraneum]|uniref:Uncharacterized protein n=1 Tax=Trifolium subterraneum TaxID=3900 RepID=A0A2Z6LSM3_TRISU|nr:hypothetical protein TSUD_95510 [Trifolium subterraneum]